MNTTTLYLDLKSTDNTHHHAALVGEDGNVLAENGFEYRLDTISILTELDRFDPSKGSSLERRERIQAFGENLYRKVFAPQMHTVLQQTLQASDWLRVVVRIAAESAQLSHIPWEFLHDGNGFLAADEKIGVLRCPQQIVPKPLKPIEDDKIRILCLVSSPLDLTEEHRLAVEWEQERLLQALDRSLGAGAYEIKFEDASLANLEAALDEGRYHILHYTGHGAFIPRVGGALVLEDEQGKKKYVGWKDLKFVIEKGVARGLRLVFLSGCQTAKPLYRIRPGCESTTPPPQGGNEPTPDPSQEGNEPTSGSTSTGSGQAPQEGNAFNDLARPLLQAGVAAVIAMQYSISDEAGRVLAEHFYQALTRGEAVDAALSDARRRLLLHQSLVVQGDFATPVLFSTDVECLRRSETSRKQSFRTPEIDTAFQLTGLQQLGVGFVGRRKELRQIKQLFLQGNVRAIILHGIGGIGKTVTATQAARRLRKAFQGVYAFDCTDGMLSPDQLVTEAHHFLQANGIDALQQLAYAPMPPKQKAGYLAQVLEQLPLLLIFDNVESLLDEESRSKIADHDLAVFLRTLVNATTHGTKFLFTSRYTFRLLEDERHGGSAPITAHRLQQAFAAINLGDLARPEAIQIMHKFPSLSNAEYGMKQAIYAHIGGHPYTLNVFAHHCQTKRPEDVLQSLGEVIGETARFAMLEMSWDKLSDRARDLLTRISVFQKTIPLVALEWVMGDSDQLAVDSNQLAAMRKLIRNDDNASEELKDMPDEELDEILKQMLPQQRRSEPVTKEIEELIHWGLIVQLTQIPSKEGAGAYSPLEGGQGGVSSEVGYSVHTLVRDFCQGKMEASDRRHALLDAAEFYLNAAKALPDESQAQVFTKLDARHLLFEAEDFEKAGRIVSEVFPLLHRWGLLSLAECLLRKSETTREKQGKATHLGSLAIIFQDRGEYKKAIQAYQQVYHIFEEINDQKNMATTRHLLGMIHHNQGDYDAALREYMASLKIKETLGNQVGIIATRHQIGKILQAQGRHEKALYEFQAIRKLSEVLGDKAGIAGALHQIGLIYCQQNDYETGLWNLQKCLQTNEILGNKTGIAGVQADIGTIYEKQNNYDEAMRLYLSSLQIYEVLGNKSGIAKIRAQIGDIHFLRGDYEVALREYQISLKVGKDLENKDLIARIHNQIGRLYGEQEKHTLAFGEFFEALAILKHLQSPDACIAFNNLRQLRTKWGAAAFDAAWQAATGDAVPEEMK